jgi:hypothetical protein
MNLNPKRSFDLRGMFEKTIRWQADMLSKACLAIGLPHLFYFAVAAGGKENREMGYELHGDIKNFTRRMLLAQFILSCKDAQMTALLQHTITTIQPEEMSINLAAVMHEQEAMNG